MHLSVFYMVMLQLLSHTFQVIRSCELMDSAERGTGAMHDDVPQDVAPGINKQQQTIDIDRPEARLVCENHQVAI